MDSRPTASGGGGGGSASASGSARGWVDGGHLRPVRISTGEDGRSPRASQSQGYGGESVAPPAQQAPLTLTQVMHESPSVRAGMSVEQETRCRAQACDLLRLVAQILGLPTAPTITALTFLLRFYARHSYAVHSPQLVVPTCLYVASKLEKEVPRRISDIVNVAHRVLHPRKRAEDPEPVRNADLRLDFAEEDTAWGRMVLGLPPAAASAVPAPQAAAAETATSHDVVATGAPGDTAAAAAIADVLAGVPNRGAGGGRCLGKAEGGVTSAGGTGEGQGASVGTDGASGRWQQTLDGKAVKPIGTARGGDNGSSSMVERTTRAEVVVGDEYYRTKDQVLELEQEVLRSVNYGLNTPQPHKYLLNMCHVAKASPAVAQLASVTLTDACFNTTLLLRWTAPQLAGGALRVAAEVVGVNLDCPRSGSGGLHWWDALGLDAAALEEIGGEMLDVLEGAVGEKA